MEYESDFNIHRKLIFGTIYAVNTEDIHSAHPNLRNANWIFRGGGQE